LRRNGCTEGGGSGIGHDAGEGDDLRSAISDAFLENLQPLVIDAVGEEEEGEKEGEEHAERPLSRFAQRALQKGCRVIGIDEVVEECAAARMRRWGRVDCHDNGSGAGAVSVCT
jgi:hypothetical protein